MLPDPRQLIPVLMAGCADLSAGQAFRCLADLGRGAELFVCSGMWYSADEAIRSWANRALATPCPQVGPLRFVGGPAGRVYYDGTLLTFLCDAELRELFCS